MGYVEEHLKAGVEAHRAGQFDGAIAHYDAAIRFNPEHHEVLNNLAGVLTHRGHNMAAVACARRALSLDPTNPYYVAHLGNVLVRMEHYAAAVQALEYAIRLKGDEAGFYQDLGLAYWPTDLRRAEGCLVKAISMDSANQRAGRNLALTRLALRDWDKGFVGLAAYSEKPSAVYYPEITREWHGEDLTGKTLLIYGDQGLGDVIQFCRFYRNLPGKRVLAVQPPLVRLVSHAGIADRVVSLDEPAEEADYQVVLSWGLRFLDVGGQLAKTQKPYLRCLDVWRDPFVGANTLLKVGICWAGHPLFKNDATRGMPFEDFLSIADIPGVRLQSLQYGERADDIAKYGANGLVAPLPPIVHDMASMLAVARTCDLVVSVDTGLLHLVAAHGGSVLGLLPYNACWRWSRGCDDSPFYPTVRLVRQPAPGDWVAVMNKVRLLLSERLERLPPS